MGISQGQLAAVQGALLYLSPGNQMLALIWVQPLNAEVQVYSRGTLTSSFPEYKTVQENQGN